MPDFIGPLSHHIHSSAPVPYARAQKWINAYTARSQQFPHMHPDAQLSRKMAFGTNGASGGITLTQLRKVSRGLGGERVTPEPEELPESKDKGFGKKAGNKRKENMEVNNDGTAEGEWQEGGEWAAERGGLEVGELGDTNNYVGEIPEGMAPGVEELPVGVEGTQAADKEERKRLKKEKRKAEKQEKEAKRRKGRDEDLSD